MKEKGQEFDPSKELATKDIVGEIAGECKRLFRGVRSKETTVLEGKLAFGGLREGDKFVFRELRENEIGYLKIEMGHFLLLDRYLCPGPEGYVITSPTQGGNVMMGNYSKNIYTTCRYFLGNGLLLGTMCSSRSSVMLGDYYGEDYIKRLKKDFPLAAGAIIDFFTQGKPIKPNSELDYPDAQAALRVKDKVFCSIGMNQNHAENLLKSIKSVDQFSSHSSEIVHRGPISYDLNM